MEYGVFRIDESRLAHELLTDILYSTMRNEVVKKKSLDSNQRQKRHQWKKKHKKSLNVDRQQDTINRLSRAVAALEGQSFPSQTQALAALTEKCWQIDVLKPGYGTFKKYEYLWIHLIEKESKKS